MSRNNKHRKVKAKVRKQKPSTTNFEERSGWPTIGSVFVLVALLFGVTVTAIAFRGIQIKITMEP